MRSGRTFFATAGGRRRRSGRVPVARPSSSSMPGLRTGGWGTQPGRHCLFYRSSFASATHWIGRADRPRQRSLAPRRPERGATRAGGGRGTPTRHYPRATASPGSNRPRLGRFGRRARTIGCSGCTHTLEARRAEHRSGGRRRRLRNPQAVTRGRVSRNRVEDVTRAPFSLFPLPMVHVHTPSRDHGRRPSSPGVLAPRAAE